jgi:hypothetical protein
MKHHISLLPSFTRRLAILLWNQEGTPTPSTLLQDARFEEEENLKEITTKQTGIIIHNSVDLADH